jgi:hypothetical protein
MRAAGAVALSLAITFQVAARASADEGDPLEARRLYNEGESAYTTGRFLDAAELFERSYRLAPRSALLWNIASALQKQYVVDGKREHLTHARAVYDTYSVLDDVSEAERQDATRRMAEIDAVLARLVAPTTTATSPVAAAATSRPPPRRPRAWVIGVSVAAAALVVAGVTVGVVLATQPGDAADPRAPGGTVTFRFP